MNIDEKIGDTNTFEDTKVDVIRKKSKEPGVAARKKTRRVKMSLSKYMKSFGVGAVVVGVALPQVEKVKEGFVDTSIISEYQMDFRTRVVNPCAHLCADQVNVWYEYDNIASKMKKYEDFDIAVYLLCTVDSHLPINSVLACTQYENLDDYLESRGYKDKEEFMEVSREKILLSADVIEKSQKFKAMQYKYDEQKVDSFIDGGKK